MHSTASPEHNGKVIKQGGQSMLYRVILDGKEYALKLFRDEQTFRVER